MCCVMTELHAEDFYPLQTNNTWSYRVFYNNWPLPADSVATRFTVTGDTLMPNGRVYRRLERTDPLGAKFVRVDSAYVYYYSQYDNRDIAVYNLRAATGTLDSVQWRGLFTARVSVGTAFVFGRQRATRTYSFDGIVLFSATLADGLGIIEAIDFADGVWPYYSRSSIRGCVIRDTLYGVLLNVPRFEGLPASYELYQNYPNPFNPSTEIRYQISSAGHVSLKVFDLLGREVATLVDEEKLPGIHAVTWNAAGFASGVYLYRLQAGSFVETKRLMIIR